MMMRVMIMTMMMMMMMTMMMMMRVVMMKMVTVVHAICQVMRNLLVKVLTLSDQSGFRSLAIPAIGTGNLGVPASVAGELMYDEVFKFSRAKPSTSLKDIRFVVYDKDQPTLNVSCF